MIKTRFVFLLCLGVALVCCCLAQQAYSQARPQDTYTFKGGPLGAVKLDHKAHVDRGAKCETCHHASKLEKPMSAAQQTCGTCHTTPVKPPMKTNKMAAFHNVQGTAGTCVDCHKAEAAKGKKSPVKCVDCHKRA